MFKSIFKKSNNNFSKKNSSFIDFAQFISNENDVANASSYNSNAIVHRCVSLISTSASHVAWKVYSSNNMERQLNVHHPINSLISHPNSEQSGADFFTYSISNLLLTGDSYILISNSNEGGFDLYNLQSSLVKQVYSGDKLVAYEYGSGNNKQVFHVDKNTGVSRILHLKNYNPSNPDRGLSSLSAASKSINLHSKIMDWNKSLLKNSSRPSGALVFQDGNGYLTDEQFERLKEQFYDNFSGSSNTGKPLILEGGLKWQDTNNAERFEKFIELKDSSARDIAIAFNVPPQLLGINGDNTYSNMQEARLALWEENIIPLLDKYSDALSYWLSFWFEENLLVEFDRDSISVLTERRENLWAKISNANFMTINEKRAFVGLPPIEKGNEL